MAIEIKVPLLPESVSDATIAQWHKKVGELVRRDENLVDLETDKVVLEVPAPETGILKEIKKETGATVLASELLAILEPGDAKLAEAKPSQTQSAPPVAEQKKSATQAEGGVHSPSARRMAAEHDVDLNKIAGTGKDGRVTKQDVARQTQQGGDSAVAQVAVSQSRVVGEGGDRLERRVPMSRLRARIAERLVEAQHNAAMLTTFNEVNLQAVMDLRNKYKDRFEKKHQVRLGFMSFFTKAVIEALRRFPAVNASIDGSDIVYHEFYDIGIAVSTERGLVVPVLRRADGMTLAEIEKQIGEYAGRARDGKLSIEDMTGGTFTITNGGVFGSLLATPILNPPQVAILGMHKIEERPIVENGQIVIRPMMYLALTYDHRIIDGKESVQFLVTVKEMLEDPARLLINV